MSANNEVSRNLSNTGATGTATPPANMPAVTDHVDSAKTSPELPPVFVTNETGATVAVPAESAETDAQDQVDREIGSKFDILATGQFPNSPGSEDDGERKQAHPELEARVAELETRLALMTESHAVAIKERDAADEGRRKLEKTLAEFLTRFASVRENQSAAFKEVEKLQENRRELERRVSGLTSQIANAGSLQNSVVEDLHRKVASLQEELRASEDARQAARKDRDDTHARLKEREAELAKTKEELEHFQKTAIGALEPLGIEHRKLMNNLVGETEALMAQLQKSHGDAMRESAQRMEELEKMASALKNHINESRREIAQRLSIVVGTNAGESGTRPAVSDAPPPSAAAGA